LSFFTSLWHFNALTQCPDLVDHFIDTEGFLMALSIRI
jgi:hypothetical protein